MMGYRRVKVETDCINLVHALKSRHAFASQVGFLQQDCKEILNELPEFCISYVIRSSNKVAHALARAAPSSSNRGLWRGSPPNFLMGL